jgi:small-conductance mechanosensitive channel
MKRLLTGCLVLLLLSLSLATRAETQPPATASEATAPRPGIAKVYPRLAKLKEEKTALETQLDQRADLRSLNQALENLKTWGKDWAQRENRLGTMGEWPLETLQQTRAGLLTHKDKSDQLLNEIYTRLETIDAWRNDWQEKKDFWQQWRKALPAESPLAPPEVFSQARQTIEQALARLEKQVPPLLNLQQEITDLQVSLSNQIGEIEQVLASRKNQLLEKNQPPFFSSEFYRQFQPGMFTGFENSLSRLDFFHDRFWRHRGGLVVLHLLLTVLIFGLLRSRSKRCEDRSGLHFTMRHPLATGLFLSTIALAPLYSHAPPGLLLGISALAVFSAVPLMVELFHQPLQQWVIRLLAYTYLLSRLVESLVLPAPLHALYLAGLCLAGILLLRWVAARSLRTRKEEQRRFRILLIGGMILLGMAFIAQAGGYGILAEHLLQSGLKTVFACLLASLALHLLHTGLLALANLPGFKKQQFFRRHGQELLTRAWQLVPIIVYTHVALYLMVTWRMFDSIGEAWHTIVSAGFTFGDRTISVQMLLIALAALYVTILLSRLLRSLLEEEVFPRRQMDRGVRDSINKLLHYAILALGVLMALSLAGIDLKNFAVLAGALGIGIGFGLQNIVNNFVSGLILLFERPIKVGDMIVLDGEWGTVGKIGLRSTTVETFDESEVIVPNSILVSEKVTNWTLSSEQSRIVVPVGVAYGSDLEKVLRILYEAANQHPQVLDTPPPSAIFTAFGNSSLDFELRVWTSSVSNRLIIKNDLLLYIDRRFREENVEIPFPQRDLHLRSIEDALLDKWPARSGAVTPTNAS